MSVYVEFFFRPKTWLTRQIARVIGAPTCGVLRGGPEAKKYPDPYDISCAFRAYDHHNAELIAFTSQRPTGELLALVRGAVKELHRHGLLTWFERRDLQGHIRKDVHLR